MANEFDQFDKPPDPNVFDQFSHSDGTGRPNPDILQPRTLAQVGQDIPAALRTFNAGMTHGLWDPTVGAVKSLFGGGLGARIQAEQEATQRARAQVGPIPETIGSFYDPVNRIFGGVENYASKIANPILRWGARAIGQGTAGAAYSGTKAVAEGQPVMPAMTWGATTGALASPIAAMGNVTSRPGAPTTAEFQQKLEDARQTALSTGYSTADARAASYGANLDAKHDQYMGATDANSVGTVHNNFQKWANNPDEPHSVSQLMDWRDKANSVGATQLVDRINDMFENGTPMGGVEGSGQRISNAVTSADKNWQISSGLEKPVDTTVGGIKTTRPMSYNEASDLTGQDTYLGSLAQNTSDHAWRVAHGLGEPLAAGLAFHGAVPEALATVGLSTIAAPALKGVAQSTANRQVGNLRNAWASGIQGPTSVATNSDWIKALYSLSLGGQ